MVKHRFYVMLKNPCDSLNKCLVTFTNIFKHLRQCSNVKSTHHYENGTNTLANKTQFGTCKVKMLKSGTSSPLCNTLACATFINLSQAVLIRRSYRNWQIYWLAPDFVNLPFVFKLLSEMCFCLVTMNILINFKAFQYALTLIL